MSATGQERRLADAMVEVLDDAAKAWEAAMAEVGSTFGEKDRKFLAANVERAKLELRLIDDASRGALVIEGEKLRPDSVPGHDNPLICHALACYRVDLFAVDELAQHYGNHAANWRAIGHAAERLGDRLMAMVGWQITNADEPRRAEIAESFKARKPEPATA